MNLKARLTRSTVTLLTIVLVGCATTYQPKSFTGGYSDRVIDDNTAYVTFRGNAFTPQETVEQYLLRRCAEITIERGYDYFVVVSNPDMQNVGNTNVFGAKVNEKYEAAATIKMFKGKKPPESLNAYDAAQVSKNSYSY